MGLQYFLRATFFDGEGEVVGSYIGRNRVDSPAVFLTLLKFSGPNRLASSLWFLCRPRQPIRQGDQRGETNAADSQFEVFVDGFVRPLLPLLQAIARRNCVRNDGD